VRQGEESLSSTRVAPCGHAVAAALPFRARKGRWQLLVGAAASKENVSSKLPCPCSRKQFSRTPCSHTPHTASKSEHTRLGA
jgi:hypothetical protein